jgi:DNA repair exonuclease SbcCD ATPase subunit
MSEVVIQQAKVASFMSKRNTLEDKIKKDEEELKQLEEQLAEPKAAEPPAEAAEEDDSNLNAEEKTFKKRYGDLRRHSQKQQVDLQKQIDDLKEQLQKTAQKEIKLPKSESELESWAAQYPDVYKIVETIAIKKAKEQQQGLEERMKRVDEMEQSAMREKAEAELMRLHPDFDAIKEDDEFHNWVEDQPRWVQQALYENDTDARAAARAIDLYKADKGIKKAAKPDTRGAAMAVNSKATRSKVDVAGSADLVYESSVAKMTDRDFEANYDAIIAAQRTGKFVYDVSGGAR